MATTAIQIVTQSETLAATVLGGSWKKLLFVFDLTENTERVAYKGYAVRPLEAGNAPTVNRSYMLNHRFELILTNTFARRESDAEVFTSLSTLYDYADQIYRQFETTKVNLGTTVSLVTNPSISEPEILLDRGMIVLRMQYQVMYRNSIP